MRRARLDGGVGGLAQQRRVFWARADDLAAASALGEPVAAARDDPGAGGVEAVETAEIEHGGAGFGQIVDDAGGGFELAAGLDRPLACIGHPRRLAFGDDLGGRRLAHERVPLCAAARGSGNERGTNR